MKPADDVWLAQFAQSVRKQENQEKTLLSTFAWSPEVAEHYKKKEEAKVAEKQKRDWWIPPRAEPWTFGKNETEKKPNWLPEKKASLAAYEKKLKEQTQSKPEQVPHYHRQFINGVNRNPCKLQSVLF